MAGNRITIERIHQTPNLSGKVTAKPKFSPNEQFLAYLLAGEDSPKKFDLWLRDIESQTDVLWLDANQLEDIDLDHLSDEAKARRERQRLDSVGVTDFQWAPDSKSVLFNLNGELYLAPVEKEEPPARKLPLERVGFITDEKFSPTGKYISFIANQNLFLHDLKFHTVTPLTTDGTETLKNGMADFIAQEEMSRMTGYWWSLTEHYIAFTQVDETPVDIETRIEVKADAVTAIEQRYPKAGTPNVAVRLGIVHLKKDNSIQWHALDDWRDYYFARGRWAGESLFSYQIQNREQTELHLNTLDVSNGARNTLLKEVQTPWINLSSDLRFIENQKTLLWSSEKSGFRHLYLYNWDGKETTQLTSGNWVVKKVCGVNTESGDIYFLATKDSPLDQILYRVNIASPNKVERITQKDGWHDIALSPDFSYAAAITSDTETPPSLQLLSLKEKGSKTEAVIENNLDKSHPFAPFIDSYCKPELGERTVDNTQLFYRLLLPKQSEKKAPLIVYTYGGPRQQLVRNMWFMDDRDYWAQVMVESGYAVLTVDNRGANDRGLAFESVLNRTMGQVEVADQMATCEQIIQKHSIDPKRIGVFGWSYGGYMVLRCLLTQPNFFKVGVSVAPVSDWRLYDTHYTERYLGKPQDNEKAYHDSGCLHLADKLKGKLLLIHGMADDNVLYTHSTSMYAALQKAKKPFDIMAYPGAKHGIYGQNNREHLFETISEYFRKWL